MAAQVYRYLVIPEKALRGGGQFEVRGSSPTLGFCNLKTRSGRNQFERFGLGSCSPRLGRISSVSGAVGPWLLPELCPFVTTLPRMPNPPNKAPEPTTFAVTPRATIRLIEVKQLNLNRDAARAAPAKVVAHL